MQYPHSVSPDGSSLVFRRHGRENPDLRLVSLDGDHVERDLLSTEFPEYNAEISPDGHWLAYQSSRSGGGEIYISPFPNVETGTLVARGEKPVWAPTGDELFYLGRETTEERRMMSVAVETDPTLVLGSPVQLFDASDYDFCCWLRSYDVHPSDGRFLLIRVERSTTIEFVLNWFEELTARVPAGR